MMQSCCLIHLHLISLVAAAGNHPGWAEFLLCAPATVSPGVQTQHYSRPVRVDGVVNTMSELKAA